MPVWGWVAIAIVVALLALWAARDRGRRHGPEDPALAQPDPAEQRQVQARSRIRRIEKDVPDLW